MNTLWKLDSIFRRKAGSVQVCRRQVKGKTSRQRLNPGGSVYHGVVMSHDVGGESEKFL